ncbi:alpha-amylase family protein [Pseudoalteromonas sp. SWXJ133]|uniref:alpha-amylase n=1 Tax=unclassified Pseudoalteromonas TaxID=194690 RepID=UPI001409E78E|nr:MULTISPECIES: alpha-amylase family protein [unclassified Pseudoalteromonas]MBH0021896.1 alpha-amylase family protein [Pseudoalteromonas sp. SWXJ133]
MKLNKIITTAGLSLGLLLPSIATATPTTFVHLFEWNWQDVAQECEQYLGPKGYAAVQVSPPNEHITGSQWWTRYQPVSYELQSRGGNRAQFIDMVNRCSAAGVDIYVDTLINHMAAGSGTGTAGNSFGNKSFPIYSPQDFHESCTINNSDYGNDRYRVQNCELVGLADLDTASNYVQNTIAAYINDLQAIGVKGFRFDASKHVAASDIQSLMAKVNGSPVVFQEVIDQGGEAVGASEYLSTGLVTEFKYSTELGNTFRNGSLAWLSNFGEGWGFMPSSSAVVFVDNHDNQRGHGGAGNVITFEDGRLYDLANVFMLAYPYGYPKVMSSYDFHGDTDAGGPNVPVHNNGNLECFASNWKCEHRWSYIAGGVDFRNNTADNWAVTNWWDNTNNQISFGRGSSGHMAINKEDSMLTATVQTDMAPGQYCNVLKGELSADAKSCSGEVITVNSDGTINLNIGAWDAMAIHKNAKLNTSSASSTESDWQRTVIFINAQTQSGQDMFIRGGIDHAYANANLGRNCQTSNFECAMPIRHNNLKNVTTSPWKANDNYLDWYGIENGQSSEAEGSATDWTTNVWPAGWGAEKTVNTDGFGVTPLNIWGEHYWMLDVDMDCSKAVNGWFELKAFIKNGQGWETAIAQDNPLYTSTNHMAQCGKINKFEFNNSGVVIRSF